MPVAIPSERSLALHAKNHPDHKYKARTLGAGVACAICRERQNREYAQRKAALATVKPRHEARREAEPLPQRTSATVPGVGLTLGELASAVGKARLAGLTDSSRVQVVTEREFRAADQRHYGKRIAALTITPRQDEGGRWKQVAGWSQTPERRPRDEPARTVRDRPARDRPA